MNRHRQFWTLLRFQVETNPFVFFYVLAFSSSLFFDFAESLHFLVSVQNLFFVGFFGVMILVPEYFQNGWGRMPSPTTPVVDFLLTRAVDRDLVARSKTVVFYCSAILVPLLLLVPALHAGDLHIRIYDRAEMQTYHALLPGSTISSELLSVPGGKLFFDLWHLWLILAAAMVVQLLILVIQPFGRRRTYILYALFCGLIVVPLAGIWTHQAPSLSEHLFMIFASHRLSAWCVLILLLVLTQWLWERSYARFEH